MTKPRSAIFQVQALRASPCHPGCETHCPVGTRRAVFCRAPLGLGEPFPPLAETNEPLRSRVLVEVPQRWYFIFECIQVRLAGAPETVEVR